MNFEMLRRTSLVDTLTGVNNRRFFEQRINEEIDRAARNSDLLSCLFLDIDHFKSINDNYGHPVGDQVLAAVAGEIRSQLRNADVLARYGGEEFIALLVGTEAKAKEIAERIRLCVENYRFTSKEESRIKVTLSVGIATLIPQSNRKASSADAEELIRLADTALYDAKQGGRNRVVSRGCIAPQNPVYRVKMS